MKKVAIFIAFVFSFAVQADPKDYPPTAFQLAQIVHYVMKTDEVYPEVRDIKMAADAKEVFDKGLYGLPKAAAFLKQAEAVIKREIKETSAATEAEWKEFVRKAVGFITKNAKSDTLKASFTVHGCQEIIVKAILIEDKAMKEGKVVLWRGTDHVAEKAKAETVTQRSYIDHNGEHKIKENPKYHSFSLGLFSGFLFDGHVNHFLGSMRSTSACTYTYYSALLHHKQILEEGKAGLYRTMRQEFADFFKENSQYPQEYDEHENLRTLFQTAVDWLNAHRRDVFTHDMYNKVSQHLDCLYRGFRGENFQTLPAFHLYGVTISPAELEHARLESAKGYDPLAVDTNTQRGEFLKAEHAVYGHGEVFHPKLVFPQQGQIIKIFDHVAEADEAAE